MELVDIPERAFTPDFEVSSDEALEEQQLTSNRYFDGRSFIFRTRSHVIKFESNCFPPKYGL